MHLCINAAFFIDATVVVDQVLSNLDRHVRQAHVFSMVVDGEILGRLAGIGLVVTNQVVPLPNRRRSSPAATSSSLSHSTPICQGRDTPFSTGVKL